MKSNDEHGTMNDESFFIHPSSFLLFSSATIGIWNLFLLLRATSSSLPADA